MSGFLFFLTELHTAIITAQGHSDDVCLTVFLLLALRCEMSSNTLADLLVFVELISSPSRDKPKSVKRHVRLPLVSS